MVDKRKDFKEKKRDRDIEREREKQECYRVPRSLWAGVKLIHI